jgi:hypothetical protein
MIHVEIEVPHGPIVETFLERGFNTPLIESTSRPLLADRRQRR